jgi:pimeloyl-ACP methyl ester carboxylesterase
MSDPAVTTVDFDGFPIRVWSKGKGPKLGYFAGIAGLPRWTPFLDRLAESRTVIAPSLPGFPGGDKAHTVIDSHLEWIVAARRIFDQAGLEGADLVASSVGAALAAELAALWPRSVRRLVLIAPFGLWDNDEPTETPFAQYPDAIAPLLCAKPELYAALREPPQGSNSVEWQIEQTRANEATARILWPIGDTRLAKRLPLLTSPTLLLWGEKDRVIPRSYADRFAKLIKGKTEIRTIPGAGHIAELDEPDATAAAVLEWVEAA